MSESRNFIQSAAAPPRLTTGSCSRYVGRYPRLVLWSFLSAPNLYVTSTLYEHCLLSDFSTAHKHQHPPLVTYHLEHALLSQRTQCPCYGRKQRLRCSDLRETRSRRSKCRGQLRVGRRQSKTGGREVRELWSQGLCNQGSKLPSDHAYE